VISIREIVIYLMREKGFDAVALEDLIDHRSGLLGISGITGDMRILHEAAPTCADARLAIEMFCYCLRKEIAAMAAALDGLDLLVFTGGIGENDAKVARQFAEGFTGSASILIRRET
jgi:acetate kinase